MIELPASLEILEPWAFYCNGLKTVINHSETPLPIEDNVFLCGEGSLKPLSEATLYVPFGSKIKYQSATGWRNFNNIVEDNSANISIIKSVDTHDMKIYTIQGHLLETPQKGINIIGRRKAIVK